MPIKTQQAAGAKLILKILRNGNYLTNAEGADEVTDFCMSMVINEGIDSAAIYAEIAIQDSANLINKLTGSETWEITLQTGNSDARYYMDCYNIDSRARSGNTDAYIVHLVSREFIQNESKSLFGSSKVLFNQKTKAEDIVKKIVKDLPSKKKLHSENSLNSHIFIACNWRPFDTIYWVAKMSVRSGGGSGNKSQNGFLFWENKMGYHFKSIDKIIEDVNSQSVDTKTNLKNGVARLYRYAYEPKKAGDEDSDPFRIESITFPENRNYLLSMRNGSYCGYSVGVDPVKFGNSKVAPDTYTASGAEQYDLEDMWKKMSHITPGKNPVKEFDQTTQQLIRRPRRIRYSLIPNRNYDQKGSTADNKQYEELTYLQAYQHMRLQSFKNVRVLITVPGNLDLYAGYGIDLYIPKTKPKRDKIERDAQYSGRYVIASIRHKYDGTTQTLYTEMLCYRDTIPSNAS